MIFKGSWCDRSDCVRPEKVKQIEELLLIIIHYSLFFQEKNNFMHLL